VYQPLYIHCCIFTTVYPHLCIWIWHRISGTMYLPLIFIAI
jgi:hypothetical protein